MNNKQIEIPLSKSKMLLSLLGSIVFVGIGLWFIIKPPQIHIPVLGNLVFIFIVGIVSVLFFGITAVLLFRKIQDKKPGLIIGEMGVEDNSSDLSAGLILWSDISEVKVVSVVNQKLLMFVLNNPEDYISRISNPLKRKGMQINLKTYGSPISISTNSLKTNFENLFTILKERLKENQP